MPAVLHPPAASPRLSLSARTADYSMMALALVLGGGSIVLFAWPSRPFLVPLGLSFGAALWWNTLLSFVFFAQHSVLVRRGVRARLAAVIPPRYDAAFYAVTSGIALALFALLVQPAGSPLFVLQGAARWLLSAVALLAVAGFAWGIRALRTFDPFGLRPIRRHLRGHQGDATARPTDGTLIVRGPYRWVRHPLYSCIIVLMWADPEMTVGRVLIASLWTAWICVGAVLEERDLVADFGDTYRKYQQRVPMLVPWRRPVPSAD